MGMPTYLKKRGDTVFYNGDGTMKVFVPEKQFDPNIAKFNGDFISLVGVVNYCIEDKNGKRSKLHTINCPTRFTCKPHSTEKLRKIRIIKESKPQDFRVLNFVNGDPIIVSTKVPQEIVNVESLVNLFLITGNIPNTIPYDKIQDYLMANMAMNGDSYNLNLQEWGVIISEICRSSKDTKIPYRLSGSKNLHDYQSISIKDISKMASSFAAIQSENFDDSVVHATLSERDSTSPLEKILMNGFS